MSGHAAEHLLDLLLREKWFFAVREFGRSSRAEIERDGIAALAPMIG
jgi:hypothetical protein